MTLQNAFKKAQVSHAYLFCGPRGTGKTSTARLLAKSLNCPNFDTKKIEPCDECDVCQTISGGSLIDVIEIDAASNRGIDEIRELRETIKFAPSQVENKVYIIDEVHMLTNEAFNALLKTLEEPPDHVYFILATTEVHKIPDTIISRCQRFDFRRLTEKAIEARLAYIGQTETIEIEPGALKMIARHVDGGLRDAIGLLEQLSIDNAVTLENAKNLIGSTGLDVIESFLEYLVTDDESNAMNVIQNLYDEGYSLRQFQNDFLKVLRDKLHDAIEDGNVELQRTYVEMMEKWQIINDNFRNSVIPQLPLEIFVVKVCSGEGSTAVVKEVKKAAPKKKAPKKVKEAKVEKEVAVETVEEVVTEVVEESIETTDDLEEAWTKTLDAINKPVLKRSLQQSKIRSNGKGVDVVFTSAFHFNSVNHADSINLAEQTLNKLMGGSLKLNLVKEEAEAEPELKKSIWDVEETADEEAPQPALVTEALDLFDGELVD